MTEECKHVQLIETINGEIIERPWFRIFCPDCGKRIEPPGPTRPFRLRPDQR